MSFHNHGLFSSYSVGQANIYISLCALNFFSLLKRQLQQETINIYTERGDYTVVLR